MKFCSTSNTSVQRCLYSQFQNQCPHFLLSCLFWKLSFEIYLNRQGRISKMVNKHTLDYHPSPSQLTSRIHPRKFLWTPKGFISPESFLIFLLNLYIPPWLQKSFEFMVKITGKIHLCVKKMNLSIFTHAPKQNSPASFYHYPRAERKSPIPPE